MAHFYHPSICGSLFIFFIGVWLLYNVVLASAVQWSGWAEILCYPAGSVSLFLNRFSLYLLFSSHSLSLISTVPPVFSIHTANLHVYLFYPLPIYGSYGLWVNPLNLCKEHSIGLFGLPFQNTTQMWWLEQQMFLRLLEAGSLRPIWQQDWLLKSLSWAYEGLLLCMHHMVFPFLCAYISGHYISSS